MKICNCNICYFMYSIKPSLTYGIMYYHYRSLGLRLENGERLDIISDGVILDLARANVQVEGGQQGNVIIKLPSYFYDGDTAEANVMAIGVLM